MTQKTKPELQEPELLQRRLVELERRGREQAATLEAVQRLSQLLTADLPLEHLLQTVTDIATELVGAEYGAFCPGANLPLYAVSGRARERSPQPPEPFILTQGVRADDVSADARGDVAARHLGVGALKSYLAVPVVSRQGEVLGGLVFGHSAPGLFAAPQEKLMRAVAAQTAAAIDNTRLYATALQGRSEAEMGRQRFNVLAEALPQLIWMTNARGIPEYFNQRWVEYTGQSMVDSLADGFIHFIHEDDVPTTNATWEDAIETGEPWQVEYRIRRPDGSYHWFLVRGVPLLEDGEVAKWIGTCTDIDQQKQVEQALKQQTRELEAAIADRASAELSLRRTQDQLESRVARRTRELEKANERLTEVDRLKSDFLATMSHELRTPLNSIIGFTGIILQGLTGDLNDEQRKQLTLVYNAGQHLLKLITEILDVSRIESGKARIQMEQFDLGLLINHVIDSLEVMIAKRGLQVIANGQDEGIVVRTDRQKLTQVMLNLLGNAIKFTPRGTITVSWQTSQQGFVVAVQDTGIGMKQEDMGHLFEPFRQLDTSSHRSYEGTGLGLYLSRKLAQLLGGDITVQSVFGTGTTFTLTLPQGELPPDGDA